MVASNVDALVLRVAPSGEMDKLVTLYSQELGKIRALAKGAGKPGSKRGSVLRLFTRGNFFLTGRRDLYHIGQCEVIDSFPALFRDLDRLAGATYLMELVDACTPDAEPNPPFFILLLTTLYLLTEISPFLALRFFEIRTLSLIGYQPNLEACGGCGGKPGNNPLFSVAMGGVLCSACQGKDLQAEPISLGALASMKFLLTAHPSRVGNFKLSPVINRELAKIMHNCLTYRLEKKIRTLKFLDKLDSSGL